MSKTFHELFKNYEFKTKTNCRHPAATKKPINSTDMGRWTQTTLENFYNFNKHIKKLSEMKPKKSDLGRWTQTQLGFSPG